MDSNREFVLQLHPKALCIKLLQHYHVGWEELDIKTGWKNIIWAGQGLTRQEAWKVTAEELELKIFNKLQY